MNANSFDKNTLAGAAMAQRDALLRRIIVVFTMASFAAFGLAVAASVYSHSTAPNDAFALNDAGY